MSEQEAEEVEMLVKSPEDLVTWCATQDILSVISPVSRLVEVSRITYQVEKVKNTLMPAQPSAFVFSKNGCHCAIGFVDGTLSVYKSDTMQSVLSIPTRSYAPVEQLAWVQQESH